MIHIRNIPNESGEAEVIQLGVPFGRVTNVLVLKGKNQAFLEMADEVSAAAMVACFTTNPPQVRGRTVYVQFSNHRELKTDQSHSVAVSLTTYYYYYSYIYMIIVDHSAVDSIEVIRLEFGIQIYRSFAIFSFCFPHVEYVLEFISISILN